MEAPFYNQVLDMSETKKKVIDLTDIVKNYKG